MNDGIRFWSTACLLLFCLASLLSGCGVGKNTVQIGAKNFTEQMILGELMAQLIENRTELTVDRQFNLGGTMICHQAMIQGGIDMYAEYTGTALTAVLNREVVSESDKVYDTVKSDYKEKFNCLWLKPFGFNNTYALTVRKEDAEKNNWNTISDIVPVAGELSAGFTAEFAERPDGYPELKQTYDIEFAEVRDLDPGLMYRAIAQDEIDVISAFSTDGRIVAYNLKPLQDDKGFFPPYFAAPVVRMEVLEEHPDLESILNLLGGTLDDSQMQQLNFQVDEEKRSPEDVAHEFLKKEGLLSK